MRMGDEGMGGWGKGSRPASGATVWTMYCTCYLPWQVSIE